MTCLVVILLTVNLEFLRMLLRRYDEYLVRKFVSDVPQRPLPPPGSTAYAEAAEAALAGQDDRGDGGENGRGHRGHQHPVVEQVSSARVRYRPNAFEQFVRSLLFMLMVINAYLLVL